MEETDLKTRKQTINFGIFAGVASVVFGLMLFFQELHYDRSFGIQAVQFGIVALFVVLGVIQYKKSNGGYITIMQALKIGAGVGALSAVIGIIYYLFMSNVLDPNFLDNSIELAKEQAFAQNPSMTEEQWQQGVEMQKKFMPIFLGIGVLLSTIFGLVVGLITGAIVQKKRAQY